MNADDLKQTLQSLHGDAFGWALACCHSNASDAEDVLQNSYIKVLQGRARFQHKSKFKTWLFGVIRNTAREHARRHMLRRAGLARFFTQGAMPMMHNVDPAQQIIDREQTSELQEMLALLSIRQREVLHLVFYQSMTIQQASLVMNVPLGTARKHYHRGKTRLRTLIEQHSDEDQRRPIKNTV